MTSTALGSTQPHKTGAGSVSEFSEIKAKMKWYESSHLIMPWYENVCDDLTLPIPSAVPVMEPYLPLLFFFSWLFVNKHHGQEAHPSIPI